MRLEEFKASLLGENLTKEANSPTYITNTYSNPVSQGNQSIPELVKSAERELPQSVVDNASLLAELKASNVAKQASLYSKMASNSSSNDLVLEKEASEFVNQIYDNAYPQVLADVCRQYESYVTQGQ